MDKEEITKIGVMRDFELKVKQYKFDVKEQERLRLECSTNYKENGFASVEEMIKAQPDMQWAFYEKILPPQKGSDELYKYIAGALIELKSKLKTNPKFRQCLKMTSVRERCAIKAMVTNMNEKDGECWLKTTTLNKQEDGSAALEIGLK